MNKKIKKTIAIALALSFGPTVLPNIFNLGTTAVYAASTSGGITDIKVETNKDDNVNVYTKSSYSSKYKLSKLDDNDEVPSKLYAEVKSNVKKIKITDIDLGTACDSVKIFKGSTEIDLDEEVKISNSLTLKIEAYSGSTLKETYSLKIKKEEDDNEDDVYLKDLSLKYDNNDIELNFAKDTSSYNVNVNNSVSYVKVCADPEDDDYTVKINGSSVDDDDDWTKKVSLGSGNNTITIKVEDEDENERKYEVNITKSTNGISSSTTAQVPSNLVTSLGQGWQQSNGNWYLIAPDGTKQTGWQKIDGNWYYMNENGIMLTGWLKSSSSGKWYYLNPTSNGNKGAMVTNARIDGYQIGYDGARI